MYETPRLPTDPETPEQIARRLKWKRRERVRDVIGGIALHLTVAALITGLLAVTVAAAAIAARVYLAG